MLTGEVTNPPSLGVDVRAEMFALFRRSYEATSEAQFNADLAAKHRVIVLRNRDRAICGFSTLAVDRVTVDGTPVRVAFSGDTVVDRAHWGQQTLAAAWLGEIGRIFATEPQLALYWLLIVKGHRTYRYLSTFGLSFVPDWRGPDRRDLVQLRDTLATMRFGSAYDPATGVVTFPESRGHLTEDLARISERELARPEVRFFLARNPGYVHGSELVCLCELSLDNMKPRARRLFLRGCP